MNWKNYLKDAPRMHPHTKKLEKRKEAQTHGGETESDIHLTGAPLGECEGYRKAVFEEIQHLGILQS